MLHGPRAAHLRGELRAALLRAVGAAPDDGEPRAAPAPGTDAAVPLCAAYRRALLHLAARDLTGAGTVDETAAELADRAPPRWRRHWPLPAGSCPRPRRRPGWR